MTLRTRILRNFLRSDPAQCRPVDLPSTASGNFRGREAKLATSLHGRQTGHSPNIRLALLGGFLCLLAAFCAAAPKSGAQNWGQANRVVQGRVVNAEDTPQQNAIVYLKNQKTLEIKTYISAADGSYRFGQLSSDADYQIWARYQNSKSKTRSISSFDSKKQFTFELKLEPSK
jgi:hypothetical protein